MSTAGVKVKERGFSKPKLHTVLIVVHLKLCQRHRIYLFTSAAEQQQQQQNKQNEDEELS